MTDKKQTGFRISEDLKKRLIAEAKKHDRSMNYMLSIILDKHLPEL